MMMIQISAGGEGDRDQGHHLGETRQTLTLDDQRHVNHHLHYHHLHHNQIHRQVDTHHHTHLDQEVMTSNLHKDPEATRHTTHKTTITYHKVQEVTVQDHNRRNK